MTFNNTKPADAEKISNVPSVVRQNVEAIENAWNGDHEALATDGTASTDHEKVTFVKQTTIPTTAADQLISYTHEVISAAGPMAFVRAESDGIATPLTCFHGKIAALPKTGLAGAVSILDFDGVTTATGTFYALGENTTGALNRSTTVEFLYTSALGKFIINTVSEDAALKVSTYSTAKILVLGLGTVASLAMKNVYWTLKLDRFEV